MKKLMFAAAATLALAGCYDTPKTAGTAGACDMSKIETGDYCITCNTCCGAECPCKDGVCCKCGHQTEKREWCVKGDDKRRIEYKCTTCGRAEAAPGKCHVVGCANNGKPLTKVCSGSGEWPHGGEAPVTPAPVTPK